MCWRRRTDDRHGRNARRSSGAPAGRDSVDGAMAGGRSRSRDGTVAASCTAAGSWSSTGPTAGRDLRGLRSMPRSARPGDVDRPRWQPSVPRLGSSLPTALLADDELVTSFRRHPRHLADPAPSSTSLRYVDVTSLQSIVEHVLEVGYCTESMVSRTTGRINWTPVRRLGPQGFVSWILASTSLPGAPAEPTVELKVLRALTRRASRPRSPACDLAAWHGWARFDMAGPERSGGSWKSGTPSGHRSADSAWRRQRPRSACSESLGWMVADSASRTRSRPLGHTIDTVVAEIGERQRHVERLAPPASGWR